MPHFTDPPHTIPWETSPDYRIAAFQGGHRNGSHWVWHDLDLTYSFPSGSAYFASGLNYGTGEVRAGWLPFSPAQQAAARAALQSWANVADLTFTQVGDSTQVGDIRFAFTSALQLPNDGRAFYTTTTTATAGDVWLASAYANQSLGPSGGAGGTYDASAAARYETLLHEIGHALGLSHPFVETGETRYTAVLPKAEDNDAFTVMSYTRHHDLIPTTPMVYDILAIQYMYGPNLAYKAGDTVHSYVRTSRYFETIWDAGGMDTIEVTGGPSNGLGLVIDLREGHGSTINGSVPNVFIAYGAVIENATGTDGADTLLGNGHANRLHGREGSDTLDGLAGVDTAVFDDVMANHAFSYDFALGERIVQRNYPAPAGQVGRVPDRDIVRNIERFEFRDYTLAHDIAGNAGQAFRLYKAAFDRTPDLDGLGFQVDALDQGAGLLEVAGHFIASPEFARTYGPLDNTAFVNRLYLNVLDRAPDPGGMTYHLGNLNAGMSRAEVLAGFSESPENQAAVIGLVQDGITYST